MTFRLVRSRAVGGFLLLSAALAFGCSGEGANNSPAMPESKPAPPPLTGADAAKANNPTGGSSTAPDPNPGAAR